MFVTVKHVLKSGIILSKCNTLPANFRLSLLVRDKQSSFFVNDEVLKKFYKIGSKKLFPGVKVIKLFLRH
jgi:hypothetical protein